MANYYDLSPPLGPSTPAWPTDPPVLFEPHKSRAAGGSSNVTKLTMGTYAGSHVDAPKHFISDGASVDDLPLDILIGPALAVQIKGNSIDRPQLEQALDVVSPTAC